MSFDLSNSLKQKGAISALRMAIRNREYPKEALIHHSDRGLQHCGYQHQKILTKHKVQYSMTENSDP